MPVRGDVATFGVEVLQVSGTITLNWEVQTRTAEDPASTVLTLVAGTAMSAPGVTTVANSTNLCKQLVRYRFNTGGTASTANCIIFRALQPSWQVDR